MKKPKKIHKFIKIIVTQQYFKCEGRVCCYGATVSIVKF